MPDDDAARMEVRADELHEGDDHGLYVDCPECGSAATIRNVADHGRCNGYLDREVEDTDAPEEGLDCNAKLALELVWESEEEL